MGDLHHDLHHVGFLHICHHFPQHLAQALCLAGHSVPVHKMSSDCHPTIQDEMSSHHQAHSIPWFGAVQGGALVPPEASINEFDDPAAIMVLTEGGQLMVHDLATFQPVPLSLPFQELQAVTHSCMCTSAVEAAPAGGLQPAAKLHSVTLERLRVRLTHVAMRQSSLTVARGPSMLHCVTRWSLLVVCRDDASCSEL